MTRDQQIDGVPPAQTAALSGADRRYLRGLGHHLKPVVHVGSRGLHDGLATQLASALETHELIKLKIPADSSAGRKSLGLELAALAGAELIQVLGRTVLLYLARPEEPVIVLPARRKAK